MNALPETISTSSTPSRLDATTAPDAEAVSMASPMRLKAVVHPSWAHLAQRFHTRGQSVPAAATPFQYGEWLQAWFDTLGAQKGVESVPLEICCADSGAPLFGVPLVKRRDGGQTIAEFADASVTDYNAPLLGSGWLTEHPRCEINPQDLLSALQQALPDCDQLRFLKMPQHLQGRDNPFAQLPGCRASMFGTNVVSIDGDWDNYRKRLTKKIRKELERSFRVFERDGTNARFEVISDPQEAMSVLQQMEVQQAERMRELDLPYVLNEPEYAAFFRRLIELDLSNNRVLITVLRSEPDELVGALLGLVGESSYAMIRLSHAGRAWSHCSPGKIMIDKTMHYLHSQGVNKFDFTTGDYSYKKGFLTESDPLVEVVHGLSLRGRLTLAKAATIESLKDRMRPYPGLYQAFKAIAPGS